MPTNTTRTIVIQDVDTEAEVGRLNISPETWMDETDVIGQGTDEVVAWASRNGYAYDDLTWDFVGQS